MPASAPWMKFYPRDWRGDQALRLCSLAARGLWIEMMAVMHEAQPYGHLVVNGRAVNEAQLGRMVGASEDYVRELLDELEAAGVFSRNRSGVIYSRRMTRDEKSSKTGRKAAKKRWTQATENAERKSEPNGYPNGEATPKPDAQRADARGQRVKDDPDGSSQKPKAHPLPEDWWPSDHDWQQARDAGLTDEEIEDAAREFRDYWHSQGRRAAGKKKDWPATWRNRVRDIASRRKRAPASKPSQGNRRNPDQLTSVTRGLVSGAES